MGTTYSVVLGGTPPSEVERADLASVVAATLAAVDAAMSTYKPESELSRFNRFASTDLFPVSAALSEVFSAARAVSALTGGAFDVTVGPLVDAWGFGATPRAPAPPGDGALRRLRAHVGYRLIEIDTAKSAVRKIDPATQCDLSAIAKGYGVDRVAGALLAAGRADFLVEVGGDVRARGRRADGAAWRVAIERPQESSRSLFRVADLADLAMATSGDYRNFYELDGVRYSHLIDPRSGRPIRHAVASVSVAHANATYADALATGLAVLGPQDGFDLAEREGIAAFFILHAPDGGLEARATTAFRPLLEDAGAPSHAKFRIPNSKPKANGGERRGAAAPLAIASSAESAAQCTSGGPTCSSPYSRP